MKSVIKKHLYNSIKLFIHLSISGIATSPFIIYGGSGGRGGDISSIISSPISFIMFLGALVLFSFVFLRLVPGIWKPAELFPNDYLEK